jgi:hypothetical protein
VPRDEKILREIVARRAKLLSSTIPLNEVADFPLVKEIRTPPLQATSKFRKPTGFVLA